MSEPYHLKNLLKFFSRYSGVAVELFIIIHNIEHLLDSGNCYILLLALRRNLSCLISKIHVRFSFKVIVKIICRVEVQLCER